VEMAGRLRFINEASIMIVIVKEGLPARVVDNHPKGLCRVAWQQHVLKT
jgi:hypothetical protein